MLIIYTTSTLIILPYDKFETAFINIRHRFSLWLSHWVNPDKSSTDVAVFYDAKKRSQCGFVIICHKTYVRFKHGTSFWYEKIFTIDVKYII